MEEEENNPEKDSDQSPFKNSDIKRGEIKGRKKMRRAMVIDQYGFSESPHETQTLDISSQPKKSNFKQSLKCIAITTKWESYLDTLPGGSQNIAIIKIPRSETLKYLVRTKGIPRELRSAIWMRITNAYSTYLEHTDKYKLLIDKEIKADVHIKQIEKDLPRTFPNNILFNTDEGQQKLRRILIALTRLRPDVGYCQAMNFLAAMLLFFIEEEQAFWATLTVIDEVLPKNYYCNELVGVQIDSEAFRIAFSKRLPKLFKHLESMEVDVGIFATQWFLCLFISVLPMESAMRFMDSFLYEGNKVLFRVALAIFNMNQKKILEVDDASEMFNICQSLPQFVTDPDRLMMYAYDERTMRGFSLEELNQYRNQAKQNLGIQD